MATPIVDAAPGPPEDHDLPAGEDPGAEARDDADETRSRRWVLPLVTVGLAVAALLLGGALLGYRYASRSQGPSAPPAKVPEIETNQGAGVSVEPASAMPDVLRLTKAEALEALSDLGVDTRSVTFEEQPYVGEAGRVVSQDPVRGTVDPDGVTLVLSTAATIPDLAGKDQAAAQQAIEDLGGVMQVTEAYRADKPVGSVISTSPEAGKAMTATVQVTISQKPGSVFITELETIEGGCSADQATIGSATSDNAMICSADYVSSDGEADPAAAYDLAGRVDRFTTRVGVVNADEPGTTARVRVLIDGREAFNQVVVWGKDVPIDLPTTGAARLDLVVSAPSADDDEWDGAEVGLLEPTFLGSRTAIDELDR